MIRSMTGFGKASCDFNNSSVSMELSTVNHRYLDASIRLPYEWSPVESALRELLKDYLSRGKLNISVNRKRLDGTAQGLVLDTTIAQQYIDAAEELAQMAGSSDSLSVNTLAQFTGVFQQKEDEDNLEKAQEALEGLLREALTNLNAMRDVEGSKLYADLAHRIDLIRTTVEEVEARLPELNEIYVNRLRDRIAALIEDSSVAEDRIAVEVALLSDKGDVTEELVRLRSHLDHAVELMDGDEAGGRKLNFLTQEIQREINTLGSKVRDTDVVRHVLNMKSELEKFREQIQNIE
ncbi:MAG TPA: YicC family protein [Candidatus Hydrogenedentes bacterium]|nr:YicC family protein [Candidatus Hydrogenedentota bacterium]